MTRQSCCALLFASLTAFAAEDPAQHPLDQYNVVWTTQSENALGSMPVGGHDIGLNLWVEDGELLFYAQKSGSFDENNEYLKLGRVRLKLTPNPFAEGHAFRQELLLRDGYAKVSAGKNPEDVVIKLWVDVHSSDIHIDIDAAHPVSVNASYENWRLNDVELPNDAKISRFGCFSWDQYPGTVVRYKDSITQDDSGVLFHHRNRDDKLLIDYMLKQQELEHYKETFVDTQKGRTFGGKLIGKGFVPAGETSGSYATTPFKGWTLQSSGAGQSHRLALISHVAQTPTLAAWKRELTKKADDVDWTNHQESIAWWHAFWDRSWLMINPEQADPADPAWQAGHNYQLFRYQLGCNAYGEYPSKFNGGNFTVDPQFIYGMNSKGKKANRNKLTPDFRQWGGGSFTAQNQRLLYWPMLKTGDVDVMKPQFEFYRRAFPNARTRVKEYWGHRGCLFTEQMENFGLPVASGWGWTEPGAKSRKRNSKHKRGVQSNRQCMYHYESQLEFSYMMLEAHRYSGLDLKPYMELIKDSVIFFDEHYQMRNKQLTGTPLGEDGKLVIFPSTSCETYKMAKNPVDVIAGLNACLKSLVALSPKYVSDSEKSYFNELLARIPDYSYEEKDGRSLIKPAASWEAVANSECPHFYPLFPFNQSSLSDEDMSVFKDTWEHAEFKKGNVVSWHQDGIFNARMGMVDEAKRYNTRKMQYNTSDRRFPTFWGPGHDWVPDHNWGGSGMIGLQEMLMQTIGDKIHLLPAWPDDWNADFKLHAPQKTTVEGKVRNGKVTELKVSPESRRADLVFPQ